MTSGGSAVGGSGNVDKARNIAGWKLWVVNSWIKHWMANFHVNLFLLALMNRNFTHFGNSILILIGQLTFEVHDVCDAYILTTTDKFKKIFSATCDY